MSDCVLKLIPINPEFIPEDNICNNILGRIRAIIPGVDTYEKAIYDDIAFIDQGENFEYVVCCWRQ